MCEVDQPAGQPDRPGTPLRRTETGLEPRERGRPRILVVDDVDGVRALLRRLVEHWGYACEEASGGRWALTRLEAGDFSLVLTDYDMPEGDGLTLIRAVASRGRTRSGPVTPIILVSGSADDDVCDEAVAAGAHAVFRKPFQPAFLRAVIDLLLADQGWKAPAGPTARHP